MKSIIIALSLMLGSVYPCIGEVTEIDEENDVVYVVTSFEHEFSFYGVEDYMVGDGVAMLMYDNGTSSVVDDIILEVRE